MADIVERKNENGNWVEFEEIYDTDVVNAFYNGLEPEENYFEELVKKRYKVSKLTNVYDFPHPNDENRRHMLYFKKRGVEFRVIMY